VIPAAIPTPTVTGRYDEVLRGLSATERRDLLDLLRRALESSPPQPPWRTEEGD